MADQNAGYYTFYPKFQEFVTLYRGVIRVWIGDGISTGTAGVLYAEYLDGFIQQLGFVSDYDQAKKYFADLGIELTYAEWVELLVNIPENTRQSEAWAVGTRTGVPVLPSDETYNNNSKYYAGQANASAAAAAESETHAAQSDTHATTKAQEAGVSAQSAASSESNAAQSELNAATSESNATTSERNASKSESNAAQSETNAAASESAAATSESNAAASERAAAQSESNAATSESNALSYKDAAEAAEAAAETAQGKAEIAITHYPRIKTNDNWETWNPSTEAWEDTGHKCKAEATIEYDYQNSTSGTVPPSGAWSVTPDPQVGRFMWSRMKYIWTNGNIDYFYNVAYIGANGSGSVNSVNGMGGDVILDGTSLFVYDGAVDKETIYDAITRIGTAITNAEIDALF